MLEQAIHGAGYADDSVWAEGLSPPINADEFARSATYVIVNSGMKYAVAREIYNRCLEALDRRGSVRRAFGHPGKARAIDAIWKKRHQLFEDYLAAEDKLAFCGSLPWVGPVTQYHLAKDFGVDVAKPDVHLARLARHDRTTVQRMCARLARQSGYRVATVDTLLWRACATGILNSRRYESSGWHAAFRRPANK
ncbi:MAG TPA: hypothetical protein VMN38_08560 [Sphingomicrobium sp.]|nr:hypothetical protein [Sphingomicrobium sp.]